MAALLVSVLTLYSMMKIWMEAFWKAHPDETWQPPRVRLAAAYLATAGLAAVTVWISLWPQSLLVYAQAAVDGFGR